MPEKDIFESTLSKIVKCGLDGYLSKFVTKRPYYMKINKNRYATDGLLLSWANF